MLPKILIIDSHPVYIYKLEGFVKSLAFRDIELAHNGLEGLTKIETGSPGIVILSSLLEDMSGLEVCRAIRRKGSKAALIVLVGLFTTQKDIETLRNAGADEILERKERNWDPLCKVLTRLTQMESGCQN